MITNFLGWVELFTHGAPLLRYNDLFTRPLKFSLFYVQFHAIFLRITPSMESLHILSGPFLIFLQDKVSLKKTLVNICDPPQDFNAKGEGTRTTRFHFKTKEFILTRFSTLAILPH